jgi:hypothetical protein
VRAQPFGRDDERGVGQVHRPVFVFCHQNGHSINFFSSQVK